LRQILKDDPAAQILVTAQAHGAVDVLRQKVAEAFAGVALDDQPLTVRLGQKQTGTSDRPSEVEDEAGRIPHQVRRQFQDHPARTSGYLLTLTPFILTNPGGYVLPVVFRYPERSDLPKASGARGLLSSKTSEAQYQLGLMSTSTRMPSMGHG
jgi:hypothetical protein